MTDTPPCHGVLGHDYGDRDRRDAVDAGTAGTVIEHGWAVTMVPADAQGPGWACTIGLRRALGRPEPAL